MAEQPYFSVVVPTLNEEKAIGKTLSSIKTALLHSEEEHEIIVVDGGSVDKTREIAKKHARVLVTGKSGISAARNRGAAISKGRFIVFLDSGVSVPKTFFRTIRKAIEERSLDGANCPVFPDPEESPKTAEKLFYLVWHLARKAVYKIRPCGTGETGIIIKRNLFKRIGGFREELSTIEDLDLVFRASAIGKFGYINNTVIYDTLRRTRNMGISKLITTYLTNFFYYLITKNTRVKTWEQVR